MTQKIPPQKPPSPAQEREERVAAALRENLRKRKLQQRMRSKGISIKQA
jgi:hypothetical protein